MTIDRDALDDELRGTRPMMLVGLAPNATVADRPNLWLMPDGILGSHVGDRILKLSKLSLETYLRLFDRDHVLTRPLPPVGRRAGLTAELRAGGQRVLDTAAGRPLVVLGQRTASAFAWTPFGADGAVPYDEVAPFTWARVSGSRGGSSAVRVPSPAGRNAWWNSEVHQVRAGRFFSAIAWAWLGESRNGTDPASADD